MCVHSLFKVISSCDDVKIKRRSTSRKINNNNKKKNPDKY